jgi:hypothetical protein
MNTGHDPKLMALFEEAEAEFDDAAFAEDILRAIDGQRRRTMLMWSAAMLVAIACLSLVASPVVTALSMATDLLPTSLVSIESDWLQKLLAPINSVAAALVLGILAIRRFIRRIFD